MRSLVTVQLLLLLALSSCTTTRPPDWKKVINGGATGDSTPPPPAVETTNELVVYLDTSASMAGYVTKDGQSIFGKTLRELRHATGTFANSDAKVLVRRVASDVGPALTDMELTSASQDQNIYSGGETNLAGAIVSFKTPPAPVSKTPVEAANTKVSDSEKPQPIPRFHILVTDGVQSTKQGNATHDCGAGSDQFCVRQKIGELLQANWGGCILGIRADFHGKVYSEVNRSAIPYDTRTTDPTTFRPFYLYVFSPDPQALDALVKSLKERLRPLVANSEPIRELNLSFPYATGDAEFDVAVSKEARSFHNSKQRSRRTAFEINSSRRCRYGKIRSLSHFRYWRNCAGRTMRSIRPTKQELARLLTWSVVQTYPSKAELAAKRFPKVKIVQTHVDGPGQIHDRSDRRLSLRHRETIVGRLSPSGEAQPEPDQSVVDQSVVYRPRYDTRSR